MSLATFCMSLTKMENLSNETLLAMQQKVEGMIQGRARLSHRGGVMSSLCDRELEKLYREKKRIDLEVARRLV